MAFILFAYLVSFQVKIKVLMHDININLKEHAKIFTMELEFFSYHLHKINTMILQNIKYISYYFYDIRHFISIHDLSLAKFLKISYLDCNFINNINLKALYHFNITLYLDFFNLTYSTVQLIGVILNWKIGFPYFTIVWFHFSTFFTICCVQKLVCNKRFTAKVGR